MMKSILVICVGNICRSPMAQGILAAELPSIQVSSAGIGALIGRPPEPFAIDLLKQREIDISAHRAQQVSDLLCKRSDLILVMDSEQRSYIESRYPLCRGKVFRLAEEEVKDPFLKSKAAFQSALSTIIDGSNVWLERIRKIDKDSRK